MANSDPILVLSDESDTWIWDFSLAHFVRAILNVDPPLPAIRTAQVPLITSVEAFCFCRLKTDAHCIEHFLRCRIHTIGRGGHCCAEADRRSNLTDQNKQGPLPFHLRTHFVIRLSFVPRHSLVLIAQFSLEEKQRREM